MGGPVIEQMSQRGNPGMYTFPRPMIHSGDWMFSFSGLKTAVMNFLKDRTPEFRQQEMPDICAGFQEAIVDVLTDKAIRAARDIGYHTIVLSGGVAANMRLRKRLNDEGNRLHIDVVVPSKAYCTDNAAMVGISGWLQYQKRAAPPGELTPQPSLRLS
jgi:N6-L-threonylcarbamoyladenine synthase